MGHQRICKNPGHDDQGEPLTDLVRQLSRMGVKVNVTAIFTLEQVQAITDAVAGGAPSFISIFAGRIADTGRDPVPLLEQALDIMAAVPETECIWASPREILNYVQAQSVGCHIITMTVDLISKLDFLEWT